MEIRTIGPEEWPTAMAVAARAFTNMRFIHGLFGDDPLLRFERALGFYRATPWDDSALHLGAFIGGEMVGVSVASPPGACHVCQHVRPEAPPEDPLHADDWEWYLGVLRLHSEQPAHGYIGRVVTEPALQGAGIGRRLLDRSVEHLREAGADLVLLECESVTESFYLRAGFERLAFIPDQVSDACLLGRRLALQEGRP